MGRNQETESGDCKLTVKIPTFFRCPISLDVMKSPVSLCTGVTYDRSSIQRWLESGNNTCPATMQLLPSTDLVPNLTLQRLIAHLLPLKQPNPIRALIGELRSTSSSSDPLPSLRKLVAFFDDKDADEFGKNNAISYAGAADAIASLLIAPNANLEVLEETVRTLTLIWTSDWIEKENRQILIRSIGGQNLPSSIDSLIRILKQARRPESRGNAAAIIDTLLTNFPQTKVEILEKYNDVLIPILIKELKSSPSTESSLSCLLALSTIKRLRIKVVQAGAIPALTRIILSGFAISVIEKALKLMELLSGCVEGREAICEMADETILAVMERMMRVGREGREAAVVVLWSLCYRFRDQRAVEAAVAAGGEGGGLTKMVVVMQSDCSPAVREMAGDLLKVFKGRDSKGVLKGYDTKTTHIMPF